MQTPETTIVAIIAVSFTVIACFAIACLTTHRIAKRALRGSRSVDRAKIVNEAGAPLHHMPLPLLRRNRM
ncbi:hypothetical protein [Streptomyces sp. NPDC017940]|uniref:hypothetical protein n=1 Tax=Streptomyces sp. NPDC017940 TaxID=3365017 RepID=UPI0037A70808